MTNLLFGYSDIARKGTLTATPAAEAGFSETNLCLGPRKNYWRSGTSQTTQTLVWDLGASITRACNFLFVARMDLFYRSTAAARIDLKSSSDGASFTSRSLTSLTAASLIGSQARDFVTTFAATSAYRYWQLNLTNAGGSATQPAFSNVMFGTAFDFGRDPAWGRTSQRVAEVKGQRVPALVFDFQYSGLTNAKIQSFYDEIGDYTDIQPIALISSTYHPQIQNLSAVHAVITSARATYESVNTWGLTLTCEECV